MSGFARVQRVFQISRRHLQYRGLVFATLVNAALLIGAHVAVNPSHQAISGNGSTSNQAPKDPLIDRMLDDPIAILTIGVVLLTGMLVYVTYRLVDSTLLLWQAGERQIGFLQESSERQLRAYVGIENGRISKFAENVPTEVVFLIRNFGQTLAYHTITSLNAILRGTNGGEIASDPEVETPNVLMPGQSISCSIDVKQAASVIGYEDLVVKGVVSYRDAFNKERKTRINGGAKPTFGTSIRFSPGGNDSD